jgi:hypothetical protein
MAQQYVMERERSIHAQVAGGDVDSTDSGSIDLFEDDGFELFDDDPAEDMNNTGENSKQEDFGDNVELF